VSQQDQATYTNLPFSSSSLKALRTASSGDDLLVLLTQIQQAALTSPSLSAFMNVTAEQLKQTLNAECVLIFRLRSTQSNADIIAQSGHESADTHQTLTIDQLSRENGFSCIDKSETRTQANTPPFLGRYTAKHTFSQSIEISDKPYAYLSLHYAQPLDIRLREQLGVLIPLITQVIAVAVTRNSRTLRLQQQRDEAIRSNQMKTGYLASTSHEIRTPMSGVVGVLELLQDTRLDAKQSEYVEIAKRSAETLLELIDNVLDLAKIEIGKLSLEKIEFNLEQALRKTAELFSNRAALKGLTFHYEISEKLPVKVIGDPTRLGQVITNLLGNALKFTQQGEIRFQAYPLSIDNAVLKMRCEVSDTGIGIPDEAHQKIFESYSQADDSTTRKFGGTGLGLAICKQIVSLMNGSIAVVKSAPEQGTTIGFTVHVPVAEPGSDNLKNTTSNQAHHILVIGDDMLQSPVIGWLKNIDAEISLASTGLEAISKIHEFRSSATRISAILVGNELPGMTKNQLLQVLSQTEEAHGIRLINILLPDQPPQPGLPDAIKQIHLEQKKVLSALANMPVNHPDSATQNGGESSSDIANKAQYRILVAEDNPVNRKVVMDTLGKLGYQATIVEDGQKAVDAVRKQPFDLILMDCQMPIKDGYQATQEIRILDSKLSRRTPVVAITAHAMQGDREKCLAAGMDDYLSKPIRMTLLKEMIEKWLKRKQG
jgi:signal transduction histidine kinase/ActR/RegA family two-component response regulator